MRITPNATLIDIGTSVLANGGAMAMNARMRTSGHQYMAIQPLSWVAVNWIMVARLAVRSAYVN